MYKLKKAFWAAALACLVVGDAMAIEEAEYTVILSEDIFEVREYQSHIIAETVIEGDFENAGDEAFSKLFDYISGNNKAKQEVEMTTPIGQANESQEIDMTTPVGQELVAGKWAVSFMMPASFTMDTVPEPKDSSVIIREVPARQMASIRYSGFWNEEGYLSNKEKLETWVAEKGLTITGEAVWARYNPPFMPWFLRRNEILVPISELPAN
jgi:effector-binding domain-containing protein